MKIRIEEIAGWFEFYSETGEYLSCNFSPINDGWEVSVNDNGLQRGYSIGHIYEVGGTTNEYFFVPGGNVET